MKREPFLPNNFYLITNSGNNSETLFYEDENRNYFIRLFHRHVGKIATLQSFRLYKNKFELLIKIKSSRTIADKYKDRMHQPFANFFIAYTKSINKRYGRTGSLFREHFKRNRLNRLDFLILKAEMESEVFTPKDVIKFNSNTLPAMEMIQSQNKAESGLRLFYLFKNQTSDIEDFQIFLCSQIHAPFQKYWVSEATIPEIQPKLLPQFPPLAGIASLFLEYEPFCAEESGRFEVAENLLKNGQFNAIFYSGKDNLLIFYEYKNQGRKQIYLKKLTGLNAFEFEDLEGDGQNEMIASSCPNMNGNRFYNIYFKSPSKGDVHLSGSFFGRYEVSASYSLNDIYEGSWYADYIEKLYKWKNEELIPFRSVPISLKKSNGKHMVRWINFEQNRFLGVNVLRPIFKEPFHE